MKKMSPLWSISSYSLILVGIMLWVVFFVVPGQNKPLDEGMPIWMWTFIINPIGAFFGYIGKSRIGLIGNIVMTISVFPMIFLAYLHEYILHVLS